MCPRLCSWLLLPLLLLSCCRDVSSQGVPGASVLSAADTLVWGPGLEADVVLPARFFYIQAADSSGRNFTASPGENTFNVKIVSPVEQFTRIWILMPQLAW